MTATDQMLTQEEIKTIRFSWNQNGHKNDFDKLCAMAEAYLDTLPSGAMRSADEWAYEILNNCLNKRGPYSADDIGLIQHIERIQADARSHAAAVPEGWVLVPREPTMAMIEEMEVFCEGPTTIDACDNAKKSYKAMIAAVPPASHKPSGET
jgi:hypothetical protein